MKSKLVEIGIDQNSILELLEKNDWKNVVDDFTDGTYTLTRRITSSQLVNDVVNKICRSKNVYKESIEEAITLLTENIVMCSKMDSYLGNEYYDCREAEELKISKDGSHLVKCPLGKCNSTTYKLRRHLKDVHQGLTNEALEFAVDISTKKLKEIRVRVVNYLAG